MTKTFSRSMISEADFLEAETYVASYSEAKSDVHRRAVLVAAIIAYSRPFTINEKDKAADAEPRVELENDRLLTARQRELHAQILKIRNKAVAHSEFSFNPVELGDVQPGAFGYRATPFDVLQATVPLEEFLALCQRRKKQAMDTSFTAAQAAKPPPDAL